MHRQRGHRKPYLALMWIVLALSAGSAFAQSAEPGRAQTRTAGDESLKSDLDALKAENAAVKELLRKMEEQQQALLVQVERLQRRLDGAPAAIVQPVVSSPAANAGGLGANAAAAPVRAAAAPP